MELNFSKSKEKIHWNQKQKKFSFMQIVKDRRGGRKNVIDKLGRESRRKKEE